ncbi:hypothetical protein ElyMa_001937600 [Elysia marginata]|uniref:Uncharacterized protein n=1 Tax=Elysia marginata TaxID=1093978 RepID=A0AAV4EVV8_9GAST|nr:hypothetical protein ElyMa_001937600 [Elysia marginata]
MSLKTLLLSASLCLLLACSTHAQFNINPLLLLNGDFGEGIFDFFGSEPAGFLIQRQLAQRITALETNVRSGATGGCT